MIVCSECGYKATRFGFKKRCVRCGSDFLLSDKAAALLGEHPIELDDDGLDAQGKSAYVRLMESQGWTCRQPWPEHIAL